MYIEICKIKAKNSVYLLTCLTNITGFSGFPGEGIQQPVFPQLPNMDPFQQRMMGIQQDPMRHQVTSGFSPVPLLHGVFYLLLFSLSRGKEVVFLLGKNEYSLALQLSQETFFLFSVLVRL